MGLRVAEVGKDAVSHVAGDVSSGGCDHLGALVAIGANYLAQVLGVQINGKRGRAHQIAKQHRQQASLRWLCRMADERRTVHRLDGVRNQRIAAARTEPRVKTIGLVACRAVNDSKRRAAHVAKLAVVKLLRMTERAFSSV